MQIVMIIATAAIIIIVVGWAAYIIGTYNSLIQVKNNIEKAWKNIDVVLLQRHDEIPKLIDAVKGYMQHERGLLDKLTRLRTGYREASAIEDKTRIENELNRSLSQLRVAWEAYPDLKASQNFIQLQDRISALESQIADRREFFNDSVNIYNIQIETFPAMLLAKAFGYQRHSFLDVPEERKQDAKVSFS